MYRKFFIIAALPIILSVIMQSEVLAQRTVVTRTPYYNYNPYRHNAYYHPYNANKYYQTRRTYPRNFTQGIEQEHIANLDRYYGESELERLQRLERRIFGAVQQGDFDTRYERVREAVLSQPKQSVTKTVLRKINDYFEGQLTGFEPPITEEYLNQSEPAFYNPSDYGRSSTYSYGTNPWYNGYRTNNHGMNSSSRIRLLD